MTQNVSTAVMQRRVEPHDSLDDFPTPPWATRALCEWIAARSLATKLRDMTVREPAANRGHMVRPLAEVFGTVDASDVHDYGAGFRVFDYVGMEVPPPVDWTISNPPFRLAQAFIQRALLTSHTGVAMIVRAAFLEGVGRYRDLYQLSPPSDILQFSERVTMVKGKLAGAKVTSATAYAWLVWLRSAEVDHPRFHWLPGGTRARLERDEDYPQQSEGG